MTTLTLSLFLVAIAVQTVNQIRMYRRLGRLESDTRYYSHFIDKSSKRAVKL